MRTSGEWIWAQQPDSRVWHLAPAATEVCSRPQPPCGTLNATVTFAWDDHGVLAENAELCRACLHAARRTELAMVRAR